MNPQEKAQSSMGFTQPIKYFDNVRHVDSITIVNSSYPGVILVIYIYLLPKRLAQDKNNYCLTWSTETTIFHNCLTLGFMVNSHFTRVAPL